MGTTRSDKLAFVDAGKPRANYNVASVFTLAMPLCQGPSFETTNILIYKACTCLLDLKSALDLGPGHQAEFELRISTLHLVSVVRAMCFLMGIECLYGSAD